MATVLDISLLEGFSNIFSMLLVMLLVYGILEYTKVLGEKKGLHILIAFFIGIMLLLVPTVNEVITTIIPWFVLMFIFVLFLLIFYRIFGASDEDFLTVLKGEKQIIYWIIMISVIILLGGLGKVFFTGEEALPAITEEGTVVSGDVSATGTGAFWATLFHPKVLGLIFVMLIAVFTITSLTAKVKVED